MKTVFKIERAIPLKTVFKIDGKYYERLEDLPEEIRKEIDKDGNGIVDMIEENPDFPEEKSINKISFVKESNMESKKNEQPLYSSPNQGASRKRMFVIVLLLILLWGLYLISRSL